MTDSITVTYQDGWTQAVAVEVEAGATHPTQASFNSHEVVVGNEKQATITLTPGMPVEPPTPPPPSQNPSGVSPPAADAYPGLTQQVVDDFTGSSLNQGTWNGYYQDPGQQFGEFLASQGYVSGSCANMMNSVVNGVRAGTGMCTRVGWSTYLTLVRVKCSGGAGVTMCLGMIGLNEWPPENDFYEDNMNGLEVNTRLTTTATAHYGSNDLMVWSVESGVDATEWHTWGTQQTAETIDYMVDPAGDGVLEVWKSIANPDNNSTANNGLGLPQKFFMQLETRDGSSVNSETPAEVLMEPDWVAIYSSQAAVPDTFGLLPFVQRRNRKQLALVRA